MAMIEPLDEAAPMTKQVGLSTLASYIVVILLPLILSMLLLALQTQSTHADLVPHWSDEVYYWQQISAFRAVGFANGYFTVNEQIAPASFSHYYAWGFPIPLLYAALSAIPGWSLASIPLYNLAMLSAGIAIYLYCVKPRGRMLISFALVICTSLAFLMYHFTSLLPIMELGIAIGLAGGLYRVLMLPTTRMAFILLVIITGLSFLKVTWALLALPIGILILNHKTPIRILGVSALVLMYVTIIYAVYSWICAPYPSALNIVIADFQTNISSGLTAFTHYVGRNFVLLSQGTSIELLQRLQLAVLIAGLVLASIATNRLFRRRTVPVAKQEALVRLQVLVISLFLIGSTVSITLGMYDVYDWREFRVTAPVLMLVLVLLISVCQYRIVYLVISISLVTFPVTLAEHQSRATQWIDIDQKQEIERWQKAMKSLVNYDANAISPWCNTVYHSIGYFSEPELLLAFESGLGLSFQIIDPTTLSLKSQWLLLDDEVVEKYNDDLSVERMLDVPNGALYRNLEAECAD